MADETSNSPVFLVQDGKVIGVGIGTAVHSDDAELQTALEEAQALVLEECRKEGILWTHPDEVRARKLDAIRVVREAFGR